MVSYRVEGGIGPLLDYLARLSEIDLLPLGEAAKQIAIVDNARARAEGLDSDGNEFTDLSRRDSKGGRRPLRPSEWSRRGGHGPPLAPRGAASRIVTEYRAEVVPLGDGRVVVQAGWPTLDWVRFHVKGGPIIPRRNPAGVTPAGMDEIAEATRKFLADKLGLF